MERAFNAMNAAYDDFMNAGTDMILSRTASGSLRTPESDEAMQAFKDKLELFRASIDLTEDLVLSAQRALIPAFASPSAIIDSNVDVNPTPEDLAPPDNVADSTSVPAAAVPSPSSPATSGDRESEVVAAE